MTNDRAVLGANDAFADGGIDLRNVSAVTVTNGTISNFDAGVVVRGGSRNVITKLTVRQNVSNSLSCDLGDGIVTFNSSENSIHENTIELNGPLSGIVIVGPSSGNSIRGNRVRDNAVPNANCGNARQDIGVRLEGPGAVGNKVDGNLVERSGTALPASPSTAPATPTRRTTTTPSPGTPSSRTATVAVAAGP